MKWIKKIVRGTIERAGYDVNLRSNPAPRTWILAAQLNRRGIDCVFDVGANTGQFGTDLRASGFRGRIVSFEPLAAPFKRLQDRALIDQNWICQNVALGRGCEPIVMNVSANSVSSSILTVEQRNVLAEPAVATVATEVVEQSTLDISFPLFRASAKRVFLKLDVQGFEREVLAGASKSLSEFDGLIMESSLVPLYSGEWLFPEALAAMLSHGFRLAGVEPEFTDPATGEQLQINALFWNIAKCP